MNFKENNKAIYLQIADRICDEILAGNLVPEARIASVREYAATLEVNANTVMRSYEYLDRLGVIFNRRGIGFFVTPTAPALIRSLRRETFLKGETQYFFQQFQLLGISPEELTEMYKQYIKDNES